MSTENERPIHVRDADSKGPCRAICTSVRLGSYEHVLCRRNHQHHDPQKPASKLFCFQHMNDYKTVSTNECKKHHHHVTTTADGNIVHYFLKGTNQEEEKVEMREQIVEKDGKNEECW